MDSKNILKEITTLANKINEPIRIMEVCGTHTVSIFRNGIRQLLPKNIELVSGPGCPVCVTDDSYMNKAIAYAERDDVIIATFGDMLKVPGSVSSLAEAKAKGADIRIVYSPLDSIEIAKENPNKKIIFLAVGFETTAPTAAALTLAAKAENIANLFLLSAQKLVPPALSMLLNDDEVKVDGFLLPGHVAVVTGIHPFDFITNYNVPGVVAGFEADEILSAICLLLQMKASGDIRIVNAYPNVVKENGNIAARNAVDTVYEKTDANWRGIGTIPASGLKIRPSFADFDIEQKLPITTDNAVTKKTLCRCGDILKGIATPKSCPLFGKACVPAHAVGPCMVSVEGVCAAYYKYGGNSFEFH